MQLLQVCPFTIIFGRSIEASGASVEGSLVQRHYTTVTGTNVRDEALPDRCLDLKQRRPTSLPVQCHFVQPAADVSQYRLFSPALSLTHSTVLGIRHPQHVNTLNQDKMEHNCCEHFKCSFDGCAV